MERRRCAGWRGLRASGGTAVFGACLLSTGAHGADDMLRSGTAFYVSRSGEMLTSAHVVRGCRRIDVWAGGRGGDKDSNKDSATASVVAVDNHRDVALLATHRAVEVAVRPVARPIRPGTAVYTIGFGLTHAAPLVPVLTRGHVRGTDRAGGHRLMVVHAALHEGNSGGPVVDAQGALLGMIVGRYEKKPDLGVAVPATDLALFLDANSAAPGAVSPPAPGTDPGARLREISVLVQCVR